MHESGGGCDICAHDAETTCQDNTTEARKLLHTINHLDGRTGLEIPCQILCGSKARTIRERDFHRLPTYGSGSHFPLGFWRALGRQMRNQGLLSEDVRPFAQRAGSYTSIQVSEEGTAFLKDSSATFVTARRVASG